MNLLLVLVCILLVVVRAFYQDEYGLKLEFVRNRYMNKTLLSSYKIYPLKLNRTTTAFGYIFCTKTTFDGDQYKNNIKLFKLVDNQAKPTVVNFDVRMCDMLKHSLFGERAVGNMTRCPVKKGCYGGSNIKLDSLQMPPMIPEGRYRADITNFLENSIIAVNEFYVSVASKIE